MSLSMLTANMSGPIISWRTSADSVNASHVWTRHQLKNQCRQCQRKSCLAPSSAEEPVPTVSTQVMSGPSSAEEPVPTVSTQVMSGPVISWRTSADSVNASHVWPIISWRTSADSVNTSHVWPATSTKASCCAAAGAGCANADTASHQSTCAGAEGVVGDKKGEIVNEGGLVRRTW